MTCKSCKGTRRIELAFSVVECLDCLSPLATDPAPKVPGQPASLPAAPMAKCRPNDGWRVGDRFTHRFAPGLTGTVVSRGGDSDFMAVFNGQVGGFAEGEPMEVSKMYMSKAEDTI